MHPAAGSRAARDDLVCKALADWRRRAILDLLKAEPRTAGDLCDHFAATLDRCKVILRPVHRGELARLEAMNQVGRATFRHGRPPGFTVVLPGIMPGVAAGAVFAFLASFDEATWRASSRA